MIPKVQNKPSSNIYFENLFDDYNIDSRAIYMLPRCGRKTLSLEVSAKIFFLRLQLTFLLRFNVNFFSSDLWKYPENGKNRKEIKWLLMALPKILRVERPFLFFEIFGWLFFFKISTIKFFIEIFNWFFSSFGAWHRKTGTKPKKLVLKQKKTTKAGITRDCHQLWPSFFH